MNESDLLESQIIEVDDAGYHAERIFITENNTGSKTSRLYNVTLSAGIPRHGDPHPVIPDIFVSNVRAEPLKSGEQFKVTVIYDPLSNDTDAVNGAGTISSSTGTTTERTYRDINGNLMEVKYYLSGGDSGSFAEGVRAVDVQRPQTTITLSRTELTVPKEAIEKYVGLINSIDWSGYPPKTWICSGINFRENKNKYEVDYEFAYRRKTWVAEVSININNTVPSDATLANGIALYDVYETVNFNELGLSF
ncbi:MAG: hypothetical protein GY938_17850 [Ketobacter sp.]|nr:hypothetical protein [Ketobacter sp.]